MPSTGPLLQDLVGSPGWDVVQEALKAEKGATWQQVLAVHTSTCCQNGKKGGLVTSLLAAGLDTPLTDPGSGQVAVTLRLPELFVGSGSPWEVTSSWHDRLTDATEEVCLDTLTFLLLVAPQALQLHPNSLKQGDISIAKVRSLAENISFFPQGSQLEQLQTWCRSLPHAPQLGNPSPVTGGGGASSGFAGSGGGASSGAATSSGGWALAVVAAGSGGSPTTGASREEKEAQAQALLLTHYGQSDTWQHPSKLKRPVFMGLNNLLPKKTLRRFLEARPTFFETRNTGGKDWEFRCKP